VLINSVLLSLSLL
jgi:hypothetical protein